MQMLAAAIERDIRRECYETYQNDTLWIIARCVSGDNYKQRAYSDLMREMDNPKTQKDDRSEDDIENSLTARLKMFSERNTENDCN